MIELERLGAGLQIDELVAGQTADDLRALANALIDAQLSMIEGCAESDAVFEPLDEEADDPHAEDEGEVNMAWTLGHVIVHCCASAEESAFLAAELARGVPNHGRSRYETPWTDVESVTQCRQALEESRRMRLATLEVWPRTPDLQKRYEVWKGGPVANALGLFVVGHIHEYSHFGQIQDIVKQAAADRG